MPYIHKGVVYLKLREVEGQTGASQSTVLRWARQGFVMVNVYSESGKLQRRVRIGLNCYRNPYTGKGEWFIRASDIERAIEVAGPIPQRAVSVQ